MAKRNAKPKSRTKANFATLIGMTDKQFHKLGEEMTTLMTDKKINPEASWIVGINALAKKADKKSIAYGYILGRRIAANENPLTAIMVAMASRE
jgi:hypothetical protein